MGRVMIHVYQPDFGTASQAVRIKINDVLIGSIGPGESITGQTAAADGKPWKVEASCGLYRAEAVGLHDAEIQVQWRRHPPAMELKIH